VLDDVQVLADGALQTIRDVSHLLHPAVLDDLGLPAAIDWYLQGFGRRHGIHVELHHDMSNQRLPGEVETNAYRVVQESLTNVAKHANATSCRIVLSHDARERRITIEDDGKGFDAASRRGTGLGLIGIRERIAQLGGHLAIDGFPGQGTKVQATISTRNRAETASPSAPEAPETTAADPAAEAMSG
jgi:two-component system sensor histidine kinase UhpB